MNSSSFDIVIFSGRAPEGIARLAKRIRDEVCGARVCAVLVERRPGKTLAQRVKAFVRNLRDWEFVQYAAWRVFQIPRSAAAAALHWLLRLAHGCPRLPSSAADFTLDDLRKYCESAGAELLVTNDIHSAEALDFVRGKRPDLGIVYGTRILKPLLFEIPRLGSINIHKRKVPDYRGGGPVGLWELIENQNEIGVTVHRVEKEVDTGKIIRTCTIPIEVFDTLKSLDLKADVVGDDLLVQAVSDFFTGNLREAPQQGKGRTFKGPKPPQLRRLTKQLRKRYVCSISSGYPAYKLLLRSVLLGPFLVVRNWLRYWRVSFPVIILFHHLITDRKHRMGMSTTQFLRQLEFLKKHYRIASLGEAIKMLKNKAVKEPTVVLTFDDGYEDNFLNLRAIIQDTGVPVTMFICTDVVSRRAEFEHDVENCEPGFRALAWEQVQALARQGVEIGSHTRSHFDCGTTNVIALHGEIVKSKQELENRLGRSVTHFSFPFGQASNMSKPAVDLAKATYPYVFSAYGGMNFAPDNGELWHMRRCPHPANLWELELTLQSALELRVLPGGAGGAQGAANEESPALRRSKTPAHKGGSPSRRAALQE